jgi:hypothetical protein
MNHALEMNHAEVEQYGMCRTLYRCRLKVAILLNIDEKPAQTAYFHIESGAFIKMLFFD